MAAVSFTRDIPTRSLLAGNVGHLTAYEHIQSITVGSLGASSVTFSEIPQDYRHLQIRMVSKTNRATYSHDNMYIQFNGDTGSNYAYHYLRGNGSAASSLASTSQANIYILGGVATNVVSNVFGSIVTDILDYSNTTKNKTVRSLSGIESNGGAGGATDWINFASGLWMSTASITSIRLYPDVGPNFQQYSTFSLYGIR